MEPIIPITIADHDSTYPLHPVIETHPAKIPFDKALKSKRMSLVYPVIYFRVKNVKSPEEHGARTVFIIASEAYFHFASLIP